MIQLPNNKKCYNLPEQVAQNLLNIQYLAEQYKNIDELPSIWAQYKETFDTDIATFEDWTTTFEGWTESLSTYLANMSSAAVGAIAGQNIAPANIAATGNITAPSIIETMTGYTFTKEAYPSPQTYNSNIQYAGVCKNGNKITFAIAGTMERTDTVAGNSIYIGSFAVPWEIFNVLYPLKSSWLSMVKVYFASNYNTGIETPALIYKGAGNTIIIALYDVNTNMVANTEYVYRIEATFLLSENLAA